MAKLDRPFIPSPADDRSPEQQLIDAIAYEGLTPPTSVTLDGKIHRFRSDASRAKNGWYIAYSDGRPAGHFGCWRRQVDVSWRSEGGPTMTAAEEIAHAKRMAEMRAIRDAEVARQREVVAEVAGQIWDELKPAPADHAYLVRKGVKPHGARVTTDGKIVVPLFGEDGAVASLQYIEGDGGKRYHPGGEVKRKFWMVGTPSAGLIYLAEGFATAATVHEVTGRPCAVSYSAGNLVDVAGVLVSIYGGDRITIVADNDKGHVGLRAAEQALAKHGVRYVIPPIPGDANDYVQAGRDLAALLAPSVGDWLVDVVDFAAQPTPIGWLIKGWAQAEALMMVHGPSGSGKTFVVLDWCCRMAAALPDWMGAKVKPGAVVYLAGEGHHGLRGRLAAWQTANTAIPRGTMVLSSSGCDLDKQAGLMKARDAIGALPVRPALIVVDTLHRFLSGDENSAQDAKEMLDSCAALMATFGCAVLLVHHTGVNEEAQGRARGSSAWRGALDIEVSVTAKDGAITIAQRKSKDAEMSAPVFACLKSIPIPGWLDEDGAPVTSAVLAASDAPPVREKEPAGAKQRKIWERAWWASKAEVLDGAPYLTRAALRQHLEKDGWKPSTIDQAVKPSARPGSVIRDLLDCGFLEAKDHGWIVIDTVRSSGLILSKGSE
jgi:putative DNA primase/helicase